MEAVGQGGRGRSLFVQFGQALVHEAGASAPLASWRNRCGVLCDQLANDGQSLRVQTSSALS